MPGIAYKTMGCGWFLFFQACPAFRSAIANGIPVVSVNRVGHESDPEGKGPGSLFWGNSFVAGYQGEFLGQAGHEKEEGLVVEIDRKRSEKVRRIWPFLRDRRIDAYGELTRRFRD